ncbi:hypothetical protein Avbf_01028 [Armadillidium vulgare]|nr:hypothetical protein Avbf_01028 [Armadillidium vulgare]
MVLLPIIDLNLKDGERRHEVRKNLLEALTKFGFFYLKGVPSYDAEELLNLSKWFFNLPKDVKFSLTKKMFKENATHYYRGYFPVQKNEISYKEGFEVGPHNVKKEDKIYLCKEEKILEENNQWPRTENEEEESTKFEFVIN